MGIYHNTKIGKTYGGKQASNGLNVAEMRRVFNFTKLNHPESYSQRKDHPHPAQAQYCVQY